MICIFLADGFEDMEAVVTRDILKRGGLEVVTVGVSGDEVTSAYGLRIKTDMPIEQVKVEDIQGVILPGGMPGTSNLERNGRVIEIIKYCHENRLLIGAICAAPSILGKLGLLGGKNACCYPGFEKYLKGAEISESKVSIDENIITSKGPGTAIDFGLALVEYLKGKDCMEKIKDGMIYNA